MDTNTIQTNTFIKGMNTDTADMYLGQDQYRMAKNVRVITNANGNQGELHSVEGTSPIRTNLGNFLAKSNEDMQPQYTIIKLDSIREYIVAIVYIPAEGGWAVYRMKQSGEEEFDVVKVTKTIKNPSFEDKTSEKISTVLNYESEKNIYLYIADGKHPIMKINIAEGEEYNDSYDTFVSYVNLNTTQPNVEIEEGGQLPAGRLQYSYSLYDIHNGVLNNSPVSKIVSVYKDKNSAYQDNKKSNKKAVIKIPNESISADYVRVYRLHYYDSQQPPTISIIYDDVITKSSDKYMVVTDYGDDTYKTISLAEYVSQNAYVTIIPKTIEKKNNYLFAGNIDYAYVEDDNVIKGIKEHPDRYFDFNIKLSDDVVNTVNNPIREKTFMSHEYYKFGVVLYDKNGNKSEVIPFATIQMPDDIYNITSYDSDGTSKSKIIQVYFQVKPSWKETIKSKFSKIEVVRADRSDQYKSILQQGIAGSTVCYYTGEHVGESGNDHLDPFAKFEYNLVNKRISSTGILSFSSDQGNDNTISNGGWEDEDDDQYLYIPELGRYSKISMFASPEICYNTDSSIQQLNEYDDLKFDAYIKYSPATSTVPVVRQRNESRFTSENNAIGYFSTEYNSFGRPWKIQISTDMFYRFVKYGYKGYIKDLNQSVVRLSDLSEVWTDQKPIMCLINLLRPSSKTPQYNFYNGSHNIHEVVLSDTPDTSNFGDENDINILNNPVIIGNKEFIPWAFPTWMLSDEGNGDQYKHVVTDTLKQKSLSTYSYSYQRHPYGELANCPISSLGKFALLYHDTLMFDTGSVCDICIINIKKNRIDYPNDITYNSYGDVLDIDNNEYEIKLNCGDTYYQIFEYNFAHFFTHDIYYIPLTQCTVYQVPIETSIDMSAEYGTSYSKMKSITNNNFMIQDKPVSFNDYTQAKSCYLYNPVYNAVLFARTNYIHKEDPLELKKSDQRVHVSGIKENGELIDNWLLFKSADFIDLDGEYGAITEMSDFKNRLIVWQERATSIVSTNEQAIVNDISDTQIILGTGQVLQRYDYISTLYGMAMNDRCYTQSDSALYWWDENNREMIQFYNQQIVPMTATKNIRAYIQQYDHKENIAGKYMFYDPKYKEIVSNVLCCKDDKNVNSLVYNEIIGAYTGIYELPFKHPVTMTNNITKTQDIYMASEVDTWIWRYNVYKRTSFFYNNAKEYVKFIVNQNYDKTKVYDNIFFKTNELRSISSFNFNSSLGQQSNCYLDEDSCVTRREDDYKMAIPRNGSNPQWGERMRGKVLSCEIYGDGTGNFSLPYIMTKYRISWT